MSVTEPGRRVAVLGDVGGHLDTLRSELIRLGADPETDRLPDDLVVVQVGDLVHRGPSSEAVVAFVDRHLARRTGQWIQLVGNHEAQYLREPAFSWHERISDAAAATLRGWWTEGQMQVATAWSSSTERFLITHAGLTSGFWHEVLDAPETAASTAAALNELASRPDGVLFRPGQMLQGRSTDLAAGPLWAAAAGELIPSWLDVPLPFSQLHGHSTVVSWDSVEQVGGTHAAADDDDRVSRSTTVDVAAKHEMTFLTGGRIIGVDPCHGIRPRTSWRAWETPAAGERPGHRQSPG